MRASTRISWFATWSMMIRNRPQWSKSSGSTNQDAIFIPVQVLCELVWVLGRLYAQSKPQLIEVLEEELLAVGFFRFEQESAVRQSLEHYRRGKATFPDYLIGEISRQAGCRETVTFDIDLRGDPGSTIL